MTGPSDDRVPHERIEQLVDTVTMPGLDRLHRTGRVGQMRERTVREHVRLLVTAAAEAQQDGVEPTNSALLERGGPRPDATDRLLERAALTGLAAAQTRMAIDTGLVPAPDHLVAEAYTQRTMGPEKYGTASIHRPAGLELGTPVRGARNIKSGIASLTTIAEAEGTILPYSTIELAQGYFNPANYPLEQQERAAELLRERTGNMGTVISEPAIAAAELGKQLVTVEGLPGWIRALGRPIVCGGRMRTGFPEEESEFGAGSEERYLGCHVEALEALHRHGLTPFFELPSGGTGRAGRVEGCTWTFHIGTRRFTLDDVTELLYDPSSPWTTIPADMVAAVTAGTAAHVLRPRVSTASGKQLDVTLLGVHTFRGALNLFVTTLPAGSGEEMRTLVVLGASELARRAPGSTLATGVRSLLEDARTQSNRRRRHPERRNFAEIAQAAFGVVELGRRAA